jgi:transposase
MTICSLVSWHGNHRPGFAAGAHVDRARLRCHGSHGDSHHYFLRRRYVIAYNPQQAELDRINREQILERLSCELEVLNQKKKTKAQCKVMLHRSMGRYVKELKSGKLKINKAKVAQDEKLDGKYLLSTSDQHLSAEDIALGYKQLLEVERAFRTLKSTLCLRPVYHSKDDRIRSHVLLCWLALLLVRIAEVETGHQLAQDPPADAAAKFNPIF